MKKNLFFVLILFCPLFSYAQCSVSATINNIICNGFCTGSATAVPTGTGPFSYLWTPGNMTTTTVNGLCAGTYTVQMIDSSVMCTATHTFNITQPAPVTPLITTQPASCSSCCDGILFGNATGGFGPYTYQWLPMNTSVPTITSLCVGTYTLCITDAAGCTNCATANVTFMTGTEEQTDPSPILIQPNPAQNFVSITAEKLPQGEFTFSVYNLTGQLIEARSGTNTSVFKENLDISAYPSGIYLVQIISGNQVSVQRFVRE